MPSNRIYIVNVEAIGETPYIVETSEGITKVRDWAVHEAGIEIQVAGTESLLAAIRAGAVQVNLNPVERTDG